MTGAHRLFDIPIGRVRLALELVVLIAGALRGGTVGVGTFAFALVVGYCLTITLEVFAAARFRGPRVPKLSPPRRESC